jgi:hypothetical protein
MKAETFAFILLALVLTRAITPVYFRKEGGR